MTNNKIDPEITMIILGEFRKVLKKLNMEAESLGNIEKYGIPPKSIIVKFHNNYNHNGMKIGQTINVWSIRLEDIISIDNLKIKPQTAPIKGMYYNEGICFFSIDNIRTHAILEWQVGPRYGRGARYNIIKDEYNKYRLIKEQDLWVS